MIHSLSCGGTTRNRGAGDAGSGAGDAGGGAGDAGSGASSSGPGGATSQGANATQGGASLLPIPDACLPMDARSDGTECGGVPGYTWLGALCEPIICGCTGADCNQLFETMEACDRAHDVCYDQAGITRACTSHADCKLTPRACCPGCGELRADVLLGVHVDSTSPREAGLCRDPSDICVTCDFSLSPTHYAACIDGTCSVVDITEQASCQSGTDCRLVSKDCCDCGGDFTRDGLMAVGPSFQKAARCDGVECDLCGPTAPDGTFAICDRAHNACVLNPYELE